MSTTLRMTSRILAVIGGGYAATIGVVALASVLLAMLFGMQRSEAVVGYTAIIIWGFAEQQLSRLWTVLGGVAMGSHLAAIWLAGQLPTAVNGG